jgi:hypothetical protein
MFMVALLIFVHHALAADNPIREVTSGAARIGNHPIPAHYRGYIYWVGLPDGDHRNLTIYTPDGHPAPYFPTQNGAVQSMAADTDGTLAIAWGSSRVGGIDLRDRSGALLRTIQTGRYRPTHLAFAEDHSIWSLGWQLDAADPTRADRSDYMTVRKYLPNGQEAGAYLPRSLFPPGLEPGMERWQKSNAITAAHRSVGLWVYSGKSSAETEWVELDLTGNMSGRWRLDQFNYDTKVAFTSDGHVFVQAFDLKAKIHRLYTLDRPSSTWKLVDPSPDGWLDSADADALVFSDFGLGPIHARWYPHP